MNLRASRPVVSSLGRLHVLLLCRVPSSNGLYQIKTTTENFHTTTGWHKQGDGCRFIGQAMKLEVRQAVLSKDPVEFM